VPVGEAAAGWSGCRHGEQKVGTWPRVAASQGGGRQRQHLVQVTTRPSSMPQLSIHVPLPPARGAVAPCWSSLSAGHQVDPWSATAQPATTRSTRAWPAADAHTCPWGAAGAETRMLCMIIKRSANTWKIAQLKTNITQLVYNMLVKKRSS
jgi:hypothetical protein